MMDLQTAIKHLDHPEVRGALMRHEVEALGVVVEAAQRWDRQERNMLGGPDD